MRVDWDRYFMGIAEQVSTRATCDRKHVGCVLVLDRAIVATGYNGSIQGLPHCDDVGHDMDSGNHCIRTVHAEMNAISQAARNGARVEGATAYINTYPCWPCFKVLANAGIKKIVVADGYRIDERVSMGSEIAGVEILSLSA